MRVSLRNIGAMRVSLRNIGAMRVSLLLPVYSLMSITVIRSIGAMRAIMLLNSLMSTRIVRVMSVSMHKPSSFQYEDCEGDER
jgi:hypothetical protein